MRLLLLVTFTAEEERAAGSGLHFLLEAGWWEGALTPQPKIGLKYR